MPNDFFDCNTGLLKWELLKVEKETNHPYLNFYILHYKVSGREKEHIYFTASRKDISSLRSANHDYINPDGVIIGIYRFVDGKLEILMTKQFREPIGNYVFSIPAGLIDKGENAKQAAIREAKEEAGLLSLKNIEILTPLSPSSSGLSDESNAFVMAEAGPQSSSALEEFEDICTKFVSIDKCLEMFKDPKYIIPMQTRLWILYMSERFKTK